MVPVGCIDVCHGRKNVNHSIILIQCIFTTVQNETTAHIIVHLKVLCYKNIVTATTSTSNINTTKCSFATSLKKLFNVNLHLLEEGRVYTL